MMSTYYSRPLPLPLSTLSQSDQSNWKQHLNAPKKEEDLETLVERIGSTPAPVLTPCSNAQSTGHFSSFVQQKRKAEGDQDIGYRAKWKRAKRDHFGSGTPTVFIQEEGLLVNSTAVPQRIAAGSVSDRDLVRFSGGMTGAKKRKAEVSPASELLNNEDRLTWSPSCKRMKFF